MIQYEYPFNEKVRTYLRLEHLFNRLNELASRDTALDHHYALTTIFEVMDVGARADLKTDVLKDLGIFAGITVIVSGVFSLLIIPHLS